jgi:hypothetical protein
VSWIHAVFVTSAGGAGPFGGQPRLVLLVRSMPVEREGNWTQREKADEQQTVLSVEIAENGRNATSVDIAQAVRGHRYSYRPTPAAVAPAGKESAIVIAARDVLHRDGSGLAQDAEFVVRAGQEPLVCLAPLGPIYPENVIIRIGKSWPDVPAEGTYGAGQVRHRAR